MQPAQDAHQRSLVHDGAGEYGDRATGPFFYDKLQVVEPGGAAGIEPAGDFNAIPLLWG